MKYFEKISIFLVLFTLFALPTFAFCAFWIISAIPLRLATSTALSSFFFMFWIRASLFLALSKVLIFLYDSFREDLFERAIEKRFAEIFQKFPMLERVGRLKATEFRIQKKQEFRNSQNTLFVTAIRLAFVCSLLFIFSTGSFEIFLFYFLTLSFILATCMIDVAQSRMLVLSKSLRKHRTILSGEEFYFPSTYSTTRIGRIKSIWRFLVRDRKIIGLWIKSAFREAIPIFYNGKTITVVFLIVSSFFIGAVFAHESNTSSKDYFQVSVTNSFCAQILFDSGEKLFVRSIKGETQIVWAQHLYSVSIADSRCEA